MGEIFEQTCHQRRYIDSRKQCLTLLVIRTMQVKTTMMCHYVSTRFLKFEKNTDNTNFDYVMQLKHSHIVNYNVK